MKRVVWLLVFVITFILGFGGVSAEAGEGAEQQSIAVLLDDVEIDFDVSPIIQNGRTLVPFRAIAEALNIEVTWDELTRSVQAQNDDVKVNMSIDTFYALVNNNKVEMDTAPVIINGRTFIPARFFSEMFGCKVEWIADTQTVKIFSGPVPMKVIAFYALGDKTTSSWADLFQRPYPQTDKGNTDVVTDLSLGWYSMDENGNLLTKSTTGWQRPDGWRDVVKAAEDYKLKTQMVIHMTDSDARIRQLLSNSEAVEHAVDSIVKEARIYNAVNLDFEGLGYKDSEKELAEVRQNFDDFVNKLSRQLHSNNRELILSLHAPNSAYPGYDYETLGQTADYIIVMAYDYGSKPEPIKLVNQAVKLAADLVPADKLILGISAASETPESLTAKIGLAKRYKLEGIAFWRLGIINDGMWNTVHKNISNY